MAQTGITQSALSRFSGVRQPSISQYLSGRAELSDEQLARLLECMGYRLEIIRRPTRAEPTRAEHRSWLLHRQLSALLDPRTLSQWMPVIERNLRRLRAGTSGQPHERNLDRWDALVASGDVPGIRRVLTGLDRDAIEMREVSPLRGLLPEHDRLRILKAD
jgi:transcriptional regulator with XRE-family HTH domain